MHKFEIIQRIIGNTPFIYTKFTLMRHDTIEKVYNQDGSCAYFSIALFVYG